MMLLHQTEFLNMAPNFQKGEINTHLGTVKFKIFVRVPGMYQSVILYE